MLYQRMLSLVVVLAALTGTTAAGGTVVVNDWAVGTAITPPGGGGPGMGSFEPANPFNQQFSVNWNSSVSSCLVSFAWNESAGTGSFLIEGQHTAEGTGSGILQSGSSGGITIDVATDLLFTVHGSYDHALSLDISTASFGLNIVTPGGGVPPLLSVGDSQSAWPGPPNGTLSMDAEVVIPGGQSWLIQYSMRLITAAPPGGLASGDGFIQFSFAPVSVPEPATASLLLAAAPILLRRGRH